MSRPIPPGKLCNQCQSPAKMYQGRWLCEMHYRFGQMRATAKRTGKLVPTYSHLESLVGSRLNCFDCQKPMKWMRSTSEDLVATLQHYRDGSFGFVCLSCNTRHAFMDGDFNANELQAISMWMRNPDAICDAIHRQLSQPAPVPSPAENPPAAEGDSPA